jgi:hypothetical protein
LKATLKPLSRLNGGRGQSLPEFAWTEGAVQIPHLASVLHVGDLGIDRLHRALGSAVRQLNQSGLDSAAAQLLMSRKGAELEDLMKRGRSNVS